MRTIPIRTLMGSVPMSNGPRRHLSARRAAEIIANDPRFADLAAAIDELLDAHGALAKMRDAWDAQRDTSAMHAREAVEVDRQLDRAISTLYGLLEGYVRSLPARSEELAMARHLLEQCFPNGAGEITSRPYVEEYEAVLQLLAKLRDPSSAEAVKRLGLELPIATIEERNAVYGTLVTQPRDITPELVRGADMASKVALATFAARVVGQFPTDRHEDQQARWELLGPFVEQQEELSKLRRRRAGEAAFLEDEDAPDAEEADGSEDAAEDTDEASAA